MGYLHNPTGSSENCVEQHLKVSYDKNRVDTSCENCVVQHLKVSYDKNRIDTTCESVIQQK
jgi:hypothetical protein